MPVISPRSHSLQLYLCFEPQYSMIRVVVRGAHNQLAPFFSQPELLVSESSLLLFFRVILPSKSIFLGQVPGNAHRYQTQLIQLFLLELL